MPQSFLMSAVVLMELMASAEDRSGRKFLEGHHDRQSRNVLQRVIVDDEKYLFPLCYSAPMTTKKNLKTHKTSTRKKSSTPSATTTRTRKAAASKASKSTAKSKAAKKKDGKLRRQKELDELTLKVFQMTYDAYQQGKFHRVF
jgi:hypothetical protein